MKDWRASGIEVHSTENNTNNTVGMLFVMVDKSAVIVPAEVEGDIFNIKLISQTYLCEAGQIVLQDKVRACLFCLPL